MNRNKKLLKKAIVWGICAAVTMNTVLPVYGADAAITKDENVYVTLNQDGSVSGIYVVNEFSSENGGEISDYGVYSEVKNLTDQSEITVEDDRITATMAEDKFYYQGNMEEGELPWDIRIRYYLDEEEVDAGALGGASGDLKIVIETKQNPDGEETFFENYLLQATVVLNTEKCSDIQAEGATAGNVGVNRQLVYTILPGAETEIEITATVTDFSMDGITFQAVPMSLGIDEEILDNVDLSEQTEELADAVAQLDDGVGELKEGTKAAADGGVQLAEGITKLAEGTGTLYSGGTALSQGTPTLYEGAQALQSGIGQYTEGAKQYVNGVEQYVAGVEMISQGAELLSPLENLSLVDEAIVQLYQAVCEGDEAQGIPSMQEGADSLAEGLHQIANQVALLEEVTDTDSLEELLGSLEQLGQSLDEVGTAVRGSADMVRAIQSSYQAILENLNSQVEEINQTLDGKAAELTGETNAAIAALNGQIDGINGEISSKTDNVNAQIDQAIAAVEAAAASQAIDEGTAQNIIGSLQQSKMDGAGTISHIGEVDAPDVTVPAVSLPQEDQEIQNIIATLDQVAGQLDMAAESFEVAAAQFPTTDGNTQAALAMLSQALKLACDGADNLSQGVEGIGAALGQLSQNTASFGEAGAGIAALRTGLAMLCENDEQLLTGGQALASAANELTTGTAALAAGTAILNSGALQLAEGIRVLYQGALLIDENTGTLTSGLAALDEGTGKLKEGTAEFREQTDGLDEKVKDQINELLEDVSGDDFEPVSFTSEKNTNIGLVQFAITTEAIKAPEMEEEETVQEEEEGFSGRLKQLIP